jgi:hypothetical protein
MPDKEKKTDKPQPSKPEEPGYETVDTPFETIIDAILEADPKAVQNDRAIRRVRRPGG